VLIIKKPTSFGPEKKLIYRSFICKGKKAVNTKHNVCYKTKKLFKVY